MIWSRLISVPSFVAATFGRSSSTVSAFKVANTVASLRDIDAPSQVRGVITFSMTMATVLGYGHWRRSREDPDPDREAYLRMCRNPELGSSVKYHEVLKRCLEEGRVAELFEIWREENYKVYNHPYEETKRFKLFENYLKRIVARNPGFFSTHKLGYNCDLTPEEYRVLFPTGLILDPDDVEEWKFKLFCKRLNLTSLDSLMNKHRRIWIPGSPLATTGLSYFSATSKGVLFSTPIPDIAMLYVPRQSSHRPLKQLNSFLLRGNNNGISFPKFRIPPGVQMSFIPWYTTMMLKGMGKGFRTSP